MPAPIISRDQSGLAEGITSIGSAFGQALQQRGEAQKLQNEVGILQSAMEGITPETSPIEAAGILSKVLGKVRPELVKTAYSFYEPMLKQKIKQQSEMQLLSQLGIMPTENVEAPRYPASPGGDPSAGVINSPNNPIQNWSEEQLSLAEGSNVPIISNRAKAERKRREISQKRENDLWNYKPTQNFIGEIEKEAKEAELGNEVADSVIDIVSRGNVEPTDIRNFLASKIGENLPFLFTPESASLKFLEKLQAKGLKAIFPRPTQAEFFFINAAQAQLGKSKEANIAIANLQKKFNNIPIRLAEIKDEIIEENGGVPPRDLVSKVRKRSNEIKKELVTNSAAIAYEYGDSEDRSKAKNYLKKINSPLVKKLQPIPDKSTAKEFYKKAKGNKEEYIRLLMEAGYDPESL